MSDLIELRDQLEQQLQHLPKEHRIAMRKIFDGIEEQRAEIERLNDLVALQKKDMKVAMDAVDYLYECWRESGDSADWGNALPNLFEKRAALENK
jgi:uncharacterized coiled-coil protein SlyX